MKFALQKEALQTLERGITNSRKRHYRIQKNALQNPEKRITEFRKTHLKPVFLNVLRILVKGITKSRKAYYKECSCISVVWVVLVAQTKQIPNLWIVRDGKNVLLFLVVAHLKDVVKERLV